MVMLASATTAPVASVTDPEIVPVSNCALAITENAKSIPTIATRRRNTSGEIKYATIYWPLFSCAFQRHVAPGTTWFLLEKTQTGRMLTLLIWLSQSFL